MERRDAEELIRSLQGLTTVIKQQQQQQQTEHSHRVVQPQGQGQAVLASHSQSQNVQVQDQAKHQLPAAEQFVLGCEVSIRKNHYYKNVFNHKLQKLKIFNHQSQT